MRPFGWAGGNHDTSIASAPTTNALTAVGASGTKQRVRGKLALEIIVSSHSMVKDELFLNYSA